MTNQQLTGKSAQEPTAAPWPGFNRRSFIKGAAACMAVGTLAATGATAALASEGAAPTQGASASAQDEIFAGICRCGCAGHCFLNVHVRDGQVVRTTARDLPDTRYNRICSKGLTHVARMYSSQRVLYPMRRIEGSERGAGEFERISWDEAAQEIARHYLEYIEESGAASNAFLVGSGNFGSVALKAADRMKAVMGGTLVNFSADLETSFANGKLLGYGGFGTQNAPTDWKNAKNFVCWMADPCNSTPQNMHFILDAKENGARYVVIDPFFNANAGKADWYLGVNPATDGALAFGAVNYVLEQGWQDEGFIAARTEAPCFVKEDGTYLRVSDLGVEVAEGEPSELVVWDEATDAPLARSQAAKPSLASRGEVEGVSVTLVYDLVKERVAEYPVARAAEISGVSEDDIKKLAQMYAQEGPVTTFTMFGCDRYVNGHFNYWPVYLLCAFTGNMCKSGAGTGWTYSMGAGYVNPECGGAPVDADGNPAQGPSPVQLPLLSMEEILDSGMYAGSEFPVRSLTVFQRNVMATGGDHESLARWMKALDFVVVAENTMNETALYADILLPACHYFEYEDFVGGGGSTPFFMMQDKCTEPLGESVDDYTACKRIAEAMGAPYAGFFTADTHEFLTRLLTSDAFASVGLDADTLREIKCAPELPADHDYVSFEDAFGTDTGLFKLYDENPYPWYASAAFDPQKEALPYWEPAVNADVNAEARSEYPYHIFSQHMRTRTHTSWWDVDYLRAFTPEPTVQINPEDAADENIADGDMVTLTSANGSVTLRAVYNEGVPRKELMSGRSFNSFEFEGGHFGALSHSTMGQATPDTAVNDVVVKIEKAAN